MGRKARRMIPMSEARSLALCDRVLVVFRRHIKIPTPSLVAYLLEEHALQPCQNWFERTELSAFLNSVAPKRTTS